MSPLPDEDGMDVLDVARVEVLEHRPQAARLEVVADVEERKPRKPHAFQREPACGLAVADLDVAAGGQGSNAGGLQKRPLLRGAGGGGAAGRGWLVRGGRRGTRRAAR